jgi:NAD(P)-dependent dehydrogenase (short-subunit alcohol dehydrogenase family)
MSARKRETGELEGAEGRHSSRRRVALVTGANRGIGLATARGLAEQGISVILGSRDIAKGDKAAKGIIDLSRGTAKVIAAELDVTRQATVDSVAALIASEFESLDILVNNAGVFLDREDLASGTDLDVVRTTLETNLLGAWRLCRKFLPSMKTTGYGRVVNVSSGAGSLEAISAGDLYGPAYSLSKASLNVLTMMLASEVKGLPDVLVNAMCPGWVKTDMGGAGAPRSPAEGADTAVWLATLPKGGPSGGFFRDRERIEW